MLNTFSFMPCSIREKEKCQLLVRSENLLNKKSAWGSHIYIPTYVTTRGFQETAHLLSLIFISRNAFGFISVSFSLRETHTLSSLVYLWQPIAGLFDYNPAYQYLFLIDMADPQKQQQKQQQKQGKTYHKKATGQAQLTVQKRSQENDLKLFGSCFW